MTTLCGVFRMHQQKECFHRPVIVILNSESRTFSTDGFQGSEEALQRISRSAEVQKVTNDSIEIGEDIRDHIKLEAGLDPNSIC